MKELANKSITVTAIDIGSSKIIVVLAEVFSDGTYKVLGHGRTESKVTEQGRESKHSIIAGSIQRPEDLLKKLNEALDEAVRTANFKGPSLGRICTTISGQPLTGRNSTAEIPLPGAEVTLEDMKKVVERAEDALELHQDERLIKSERLYFCIDDQTEEQGLENPLGVKGSRISVHLHSAVAGAVNAVNRIQLINRTDLDVSTVLPEGWASGYSVLTEDERQIGVVLVDIGDETTDIVVFKGGHPRFTHTINMGGSIITKRLMGYMRCKDFEAEAVKMRLDLRHEKEDETQILFSSGVEPNVRHFNKRELSILACKEFGALCNQIGVILYNNGWYIKLDGHPYNKLPGGVVITGGATLMMGAAEFISSIPGFYRETFAARQGRSLYEGDGCMGLTSPRESAVMGLIAYEARRFMLGEDDKDVTSEDDTWVSKIKRMTKEFFIGQY